MSRPLTIAVDARTVFDEVRRGIAKTTVALYRALAAARPGWRFRMVHRDGRAGNPFADLPNVTAERVEIRGDRFGLWERVRLPAAAWGADVFHTPSGLAPRFPLARLVATVHDLIPLDTRAGEPDVKRWGANVVRAARRARVVLTPSEHARGRIVHHCRIPADKVRVVRWGPITAAAPPTADRLAELRERYGLGRSPYVLHFGMADPRKNTARVLDAWAGLAPPLRAGFALLVVGVQGPARERFAEQAGRLGVAESVRVRGYASEEDARDLLAGAAVMCYPTRYEGFGLPALDAFAAGVPVLTANSSSLPEVVGDAAVTVDPDDTAAVRDGLARLLADRGLRAELVARGRERLTRFDWRQTAEQVAEVFEAVAGGS